MRFTALLLTTLLLTFALGCDDDGPNPTCGNGKLNEGEECDGVEFGESTCESLGFDGGGLQCSSGCTILTSQCTVEGSCGNGSLDPLEECEGAKLRDHTCETLGYGPGTLACSESCTFDLTGCYPGNWEERLIQDKITASNYTLCATTSTEGVTCWGDNDHNQAGAPHITAFQSPTPTLAPLRFESMASAGQHTCGVTEEGALYCYGSNYYNDMGPYDTDTFGFDLPYPVPLALDQDMVQVSKSSYTSEMRMYTSTCALNSTGEVYCWGANNYSQAGLERSDDPVTEPTPIESANAFTGISVGGKHACGLNELGKIWCWGGNGALGLGYPSDEVTESATPVLIRSYETFTDLAAGWSHTCALSDEGRALCWGLNQSNALGVPLAETTEASIPVFVEGGNTFTQIGVGTEFSCALTAAGAILCWGLNQSGALGIGESDTTYTTHLPVTVDATALFTDLSVHDGHACALDTDGAIWCWGYQHGESPVLIGGSGYTTLFAGENLVCGIPSEGPPECYGDNFTGVGGHPDQFTLFYRHGVALPEGTTTESLHILSKRTLAVDSTGQVWTWGNADPESGYLTGSATPSLLWESYSLRTVSRPSLGVYWGIDDLGRPVVINYQGDGPHYPLGEEAEPFVQLTPYGALSVYGQHLSWSSDSPDGSGVFDTDHTYRYVGEGAAVDILGRFWSGDTLLDDSASYTKATCSYSRCCALTTEGALRCYDKNSEEWSTPHGDLNVLDFALFRTGGCLMTTQEELLCWGENYFGSLANGTMGGNTDTATTTLNKEEWLETYITPLGQ